MSDELNELFNIFGMKGPSDLEKPIEIKDGMSIEQLIKAMEHNQKFIRPKQKGNV